MIAPLAACLLVLSPAAGGEAEPGAAAAIAATVDRHLEQAWAAEGVAPAEPATDAAWFRRVHLDLTGRIPTASAVRDFLRAHPDGADAAAKRAVVEGLLNGPGYVTHFTAVWRDALVPELTRDQQAAFQRPGFEAWLRNALLENRPYDEFARELLTAELAAADEMAVFPGQVDRSAGPQAFYTARETKPEELAAATTRAFLGTRLECAECHDHPFDHWKQEEFWRFAAFFGGLERATDRGGRLGELRERTDATVLQIPPEVTLKSGVTEVPATYLDGSAPVLIPGQSPRSALADRLVSPENDLFAQVAVNRLWGLLFGRGIVDPVDDFGELNPPSHPELLEELAEQFVASGYDLKTLLAGLTLSDAYGLSSKHESDPPGDLFARYPVKPLSAAALYDSLERATGRFTPFDPADGGNPFVRQEDARAEFLNTFRDDAERAADRRTSILQALSLMNGGLIAESVDLRSSRTFAAALSAPYLDRDGRLDALFLATLSRLPTAAEREDLNAYVHAADDEAEALADVFWTLLNSSEFSTNH
ncbi:DUF1549 and DUF1553 domain-containing protein [Alienimonas sp. DA493]|uniref:DUF1549 and DUF1553 domain-containing protein n=1 Tax=Alienimonas sp. DA493 TaxID=3373605 RepID=UPI003754824F